MNRPVTHTRSFTDREVEVLVEALTEYRRELLSRVPMSYETWTTHPDVEVVNEIIREGWR